MATTRVLTVMSINLFNSQSLFLDSSRLSSQFSLQIQHNNGVKRKLTQGGGKARYPSY
jgi:hypothetical protein